MLLVLLSNNVYSQEEGTEEIVKDNDYVLPDKVSAPLTKKIEYDIEIYKGDKVVYKSSMLLNNSELTALTSFVDNVNENKANAAIGVESKQEINNSLLSANILNKNSVFSINLVCLTSKTDKNIWSKFTILNTEIKSNKIFKSNNEMEKNEFNSDSKFNIEPKEVYYQKDFFIIHYDNKPVEINYNGFNFKILAKIK